MPRTKEFLRKGWVQGCCPTTEMTGMYLHFIRCHHLSQTWSFCLYSQAWPLATAVMSFHLPGPSEHPALSDCLLYLYLGELSVLSPEHRALGDKQGKKKKWGRGGECEPPFLQLNSKSQNRSFSKSKNNRFWQKQKERKFSHTKGLSAGSPGSGDRCMC